MALQSLESCNRLMRALFVDIACRKWHVASPSAQLVFRKSKAMTYPRLRRSWSLVCLQHLHQLLQQQRNAPH